MAFKIKIGKCKGPECPYPDKEQKLSSGMCKTCCDRRFRGYGQDNTAKRDKKAPKRKKNLQKRYKPTGDAGFSLKIWMERLPRVSYLDGEALGNVMKAGFFSHVLPKGSFPGYRFKEENIIYLTEEQHHKWHNVAKSGNIAEDPRWQKIYDLYDELQAQYNEERKIPSFD